MKILRLACNNCGGPLEVPAKARFVTCTYCGSQLGIEQSGNAAWTETLEGIDERTREIAEGVETLKLQNELEQLDREWEIHRSSLVTRDKQGREQVPSIVVAVLFAVVFCIVVVAILSGMRSAGAPGLFQAVPVLMLIMVVIGVVGGIKRAQDYLRHRSNYEERRRGVMSRLRERGGGSS